ncbi:hypothetical protein FCH28_37340 [Streptomyces piniterrae]|uniref:Uncharacterized protein n=1 Tax=Streptomyces piniterrae TaxID=2571125 RepID=A0A4U0ML82_9ACTN|nr:hypothetical protein [Streptomyces piniterrae]TJZ41303.1 hypothetical protein FCH28_37340 [Streptomyces piniterrae]
MTSHPAQQAEPPSEQNQLAATAATEPPTARAARLRILAAAASAVLLLGLAGALNLGLDHLPASAVSWGFPLLYVLSCAALAGSCRAFAQTAAARHRARVLRTYPWQRLHGVLRRDDGGRHHLVLPDPGLHGREIRLPVDGRFATGATPPDEVWFAGDPRFLGVLALPGPRRMTTLAQPAARDTRLRAYAGPLDDTARARALAVGARVAVPDGALDRGPVPVDGSAKTALHHPDTAADWRRSLLRRRITLYGQLALLAGFFVTIGLRADPDPLIPAAVVLMLVAPFTVLVSALSVGGARRLGRTLRTYPWQEMYGEPEATGTGRDGEILALKPARGQVVRLRSVPTRRRFAVTERYWFAGDLRYGGAVSGPDGGDPVRVLRVKPAKAKPGRKRQESPEQDALAERAGLTKNGRPRNWAY